MNKEIDEKICTIIFYSSKFLIVVNLFLKRVLKVSHLSTCHENTKVLVKQYVQHLPDTKI